MQSFSMLVKVPNLSSSTFPYLHHVHWLGLYNSTKPSTTIDLVAFIVLLISIVSFFSRGYIWDKEDPNYHVYFERPQAVTRSSTGASGATRDVSQRLKEGDFPCVIFWGSQSGTSERFAETLGRELQAYFGIKALVADLSDYDPASIESISQGSFAIFILSTYGEGDPSDNTAGLWNWIKRVSETNISLKSLRYCTLGLGNSNYKYYNRVVDVVADAMDAAGATALVPRHKADDANGGTEEDFESWKDSIFALMRKLGHQQRVAAYEPRLDICFTGEFAQTPTTEFSPSNHEQSTTTSAIEPLSLKSAKELFTKGDRNCIHLELDLGKSNLVYKTGDHIGIWPWNPDEEVDRLVKVLGLQDKRSEKIKARPTTAITKLKFPSETTLDAALRHNIDICGPVARKTVAEISQFAPTEEARKKLEELAQDRERYEQFTSGTPVNLGRLLQIASPSESWSKVPLSFVFERLLPLQPRYYSISSSSVLSPRRISITALVVNKPLECGTIHGLASNYLLSTAELPVASNQPAPAYPRMISSERILFAHVRKTKFKLPIMSSTPIVLICAGTGFAPFRAFLQERAKLHAIGKPVGKSLLFFGCRDADDLMYQEELENVQARLGDNLEIVTAFSRAASRKCYVQDRVCERAHQVLEMLDTGASIYICGQAAMAREVDQKLESAAAKAKNLSTEEIKAWVDALKRRGKWKADVWG